ncbi:hypothetical protein LMG27174_06699 [Paraburkholderia rhynchosiae]|uniref:Acyl-CoA dehydrogenase/oxidase N-terminal domain-containing protein n=1 Tax=Paraburkholderia rhynchosiae TaxID=487049 RepID=A0A6J5CP70_9BURK|nr:hypothetical protein LMG27174_06699 [Paraburkholderia rhynchosiae]
MMLTQEHEMIRESIRTFASERLAPHAADWDKNHTFPAAALKELGELGALGMVVEEKWGGAGLDYLSLALALEEIAAGDGATSTIVSVQNSLAWTNRSRHRIKQNAETPTRQYLPTPIVRRSTRSHVDRTRLQLRGIREHLGTGATACLQLHAFLLP